MPQKNESSVEQILKALQTVCLATVSPAGGNALWYAKRGPVDWVQFDFAKIVNGAPQAYGIAILVPDTDLQVEGALTDNKPGIGYSNITMEMVTPIPQGQADPPQDDNDVIGAIREDAIEIIDALSGSQVSVGTAPVIQDIFEPKFRMIYDLFQGVQGGEVSFRVSWYGR